MPKKIKMIKGTVKKGKGKKKMPAFVKFVKKEA